MFKRAKEDIYLEEIFSAARLIDVFTPVDKGTVILRLPCTASWEMSAEEAAELGKVLMKFGNLFRNGKTHIDDCETVRIQSNVSVNLWWNEIVLEVGGQSFHVSGQRAFDIGEKLCHEAKG